MTTIKDCQFTLEAEPYENVLARAEAAIELAKAIQAVASIVNDTSNKTALVVNG